MFFCIGILYALVSYAMTVKDCGLGRAYFKIDQLAISPANPVAGQNLTLDYGYTVPPGALITGGLTTYAVTYNFIPLAPTTEPLCSSTACPIVGGTYANQSTIAWPSGLSGSITVKTKWEDTEKQLLLCTLISGNV